MGEKFRTEEYDRERVSAGSINGDGFVFNCEVIYPETYAGRFGDFYVAEGTIEEDGIEKPVSLIYSSKRLYRLMMKNKEKLEGRKIKITGYGEGFNRHYAVEVVD